MERPVSTRAGVLGFLALVVCALAFAPTAGAANASKPYSLVICAPGQNCSSNPAVVAPGAGTIVNPDTATMTATLTNLNKPGSGITLGSDNLSVPSPPSAPSCFSVTDVTINGIDRTCPTPLSQQGPPCYTLLNGTTVALRNLNLPADAPNPDASVTITMRVDTPAPSTTSCTTTSPPCMWTDMARQSNDFSGTGNNLGNPETGVRDTVLSAATTCQKGNSCSTTLADDSSASPGSISVAVSTTSGQTTVNQTEAIDYGRLDSTFNGVDGVSACSGVQSEHYVYWNLFNGTDNGSDRSQKVSITTAAAFSAEFPAYQPEFCLQTSRPFTAKTAPGSTGMLAPAMRLTLQDGTIVYQGLLPDCGTPPLQPLQVRCNKNPGVLKHGDQTMFPSPSTTVAMIPPGFDARAGN
jgi:hypothetical protein